MKIIIQYTLVFVAILFGQWSFGQNFELKMPDKDQIVQARNANAPSYDIIYIYLIQNYKKASEKTHVKTYEFDDSQICSFDQTFEYDIQYSTRFCDEEGGASTTLEIPLIKEEKIKLWIENIYEAEVGDFPNEWYEGKNVYGPVGGEAGCYYELKSKNNRWIIDIYCGC